MTTTGSNCSNNNTDMLTTEKPQNANNNRDDKESNSNKCHMNESYKKTCLMVRRRQRNKTEVKVMKLVGQIEQSSAVCKWVKAKTGGRRGRPNGR
ncbi:hypothetical protein ACLKA6_014577 [Drosophila palustris]